MHIQQSLDQWPLRQPAEITTIDWTMISDAEGSRLRSLGVDEGVVVVRLQRGIFGLNDPMALQVGRMKIAVRKSHARAITVKVAED